MPELTPDNKRKERCQAIDIHGRRCRSTAERHVIRYHGEGELYGESSVTWVAIKLCRKHREDIIR